MQSNRNQARSSARRRVALAAALVLFTALQAARGAPPFVTDDTGTQGRGRWQLELIGEHTHHHPSAEQGGATVRQLRQATALGPVITYGIADRVDLAFGANHLRQKTTEDGTVLQSASGAGDSTLELKWRFLEREGFSVALKPGITLPSGDENRGLGTGRVSGAVNLIAAGESAPWSWMVNVALTRVRYKLASDAAANHEHLRRLSAGVAFELSGAWRLTGEIGRRTNAARDDPFLPGRNGHFVMLGAIWSPADNLDFALGLRRSASRGEPDSAMVAGATFRW